MACPMPGIVLPVILALGTAGCVPPSAVKSADSAFDAFNPAAQAKIGAEASQGPAAPRR